MGMKGRWMQRWRTAGQFPFDELLRVRILLCKAVSLASLLQQLEHEFGNTRNVKYFSLKTGKHRLQNNFK